MACGREQGGKFRPVTKNAPREDRSLVVVAGARTPFARAGTALRDIAAYDLGAFALRAALDRAGVAASDVREVILGCVAQPSEAQNVARVAALRAGLPIEVPAVTVHRNCASGMEAITTAAERIAASSGEGGDGIYLVGGCESMSRIPLLYNDAAVRWFEEIKKAKTLPARLALLARMPLRDFLAPRIGLIEGLSDAASGLSMGETAENLRYEFGVSREAADEFSLRSHKRALAAREKLREEIQPFPLRKEMLRDDNGPREDTSLEKLARLRGVFDRRYGEVTAGNSSQVTDGACALVVTSRAEAARRGLPVLGRLVAYSYAGCDPARMGLGPAYAVAKVLRETGMKWSDFDLVEVNEAFAAQVLACDAALSDDDFCRNELGLPGALGGFDWERTNVNGGAIALGHPVGVTGARLCLTLLHELRRRGAKRGIATLCVGGGQGAALVWEVPS